MVQTEQNTEHVLHVILRASALNIVLLWIQPPKLRCLCIP